MSIDCAWIERMLSHPPAAPASCCSSFSHWLQLLERLWARQPKKDCWILTDKLWDIIILFLNNCILIPYYHLYIYDTLILFVNFKILFCLSSNQNNDINSAFPMRLVERLNEMVYIMLKGLNIFTKCQALCYHKYYESSVLALFYKHRLLYWRDFKHHLG